MNCLDCEYHYYKGTEEIYEYDMVHWEYGRVYGCKKLGFAVQTIRPEARHKRKLFKAPIICPLIEKKFIGGISMKRIRIQWDNESNPSDPGWIYEDDNNNWQPIPGWAGRDPEANNIELAIELHLNNVQFTRINCSYCNGYFQSEPYCKCKDK